MKFHWLTAIPFSLFAACSSYQRDFRRASEEFESGKSPAGPWKGTWKSEVNGHQGPIWCLVSRDEKDPAFWNFRYRAGWGILQFGDYVHRVDTEPRPDGTLPLDSSMTLPKKFGTYAVKGELTPADFAVRYSSSGDKGTMNLSRP